MTDAQRKALEFYAEEKNWRTQTGMGQQGGSSPAMAKAALAAAEEYGPVERSPTEHN